MVIFDKVERESILPKSVAVSKDWCDFDIFGVKYLDSFLENFYINKQTMFLNLLNDVPQDNHHCCHFLQTACEDKTVMFTQNPTRLKKHQVHKIMTHGVYNKNVFSKIYTPSVYHKKPIVKVNILT